MAANGKSQNSADIHGSRPRGSGPRPRMGRSRICDLHRKSGIPIRLGNEKTDRMCPAPLTGPTGSRRLRRHRYCRPNHVYHVTTRSHARNPIFSDFSCGRIVVDSIRRETASGRCETLCFVVMPDHLHWLVQVSPLGLLSSIVRNVKSHSARRIRVARPSTEVVWQSGFHEHMMRKRENLVATARYIIANPVRAGIVKRVGDYPLWDAMWL